MAQTYKPSRASQPRAGRDKQSNTKYLLRWRVSTLSGLVYTTFVWDQGDINTTEHLKLVGLLPWRPPRPPQNRPNADSKRNFPNRSHIDL
eukprot:3199920-Amphidinium_carterae.1